MQNSSSLAALHPPFEIVLNPLDASRLDLGAAEGRGGALGGTQPEGASQRSLEVRVTSRRGAMEIRARVDAGVPSGTAVLPFNLPAGSAGNLIDAAEPWTDVEIVRAETSGGRP